MPVMPVMPVMPEVYTSRSQGSREYMEDRHSVHRAAARKNKGNRRRPTVVGVYDGHGGSEVAEFASRRLPALLLEAWPDASAPAARPRSPVMMNLFRDAFLRVDAEAARLYVRAPVGTTACVVVVDEQVIWVANTGDSRCVLRTAAGVVQMSDDHKPGTTSENARIVAQGGHVSTIDGIERVMGNLSLSRALGDWYMRPYVVPHPGVSSRLKSAGDEYLLLGTDGLWDVFTSVAACDYVDALRARGVPNNRVCRQLVVEAHRRGSGDNVTVALVLLKE